MSPQLARRTGTVGALVVLAGVTSVAGVWPALGTASAAELRPGRAHEAAMTIGKDAAPGQVQKAESTTEPAVSVAGQADLAMAEAPVEEQGPQGHKPGKQEAAKPEAAKPEAAKPEAMTGPPTGVAAASSGGEPGPKSVVAPAAPGAGQAPKAAAPVQAPAAAAPAAAAPVTGQQPDRKARQKPAQAPAVVAPDSTGDRGVLAPRSARAPRSQAPAVGQPVTSAGTAPVTQPVVGPVMGPVVPPPVLTPARFARSVPSSITPARSGTGSWLLPVAAADALPLRPAGAEPVAAPPARPVPGTDPLAFSLVALPGFAAGTAEAVARRPELPIGLAAVVVVFLLVQNRIDRRDPKLALAPIEEDTLEFGASGPLGVRVVAV